MKKLAACVIAITGFIGTSAFAADMGAQPVPPPAPIYNWTGWYVGVNAGASMGKVKTDFSVTPFISLGVFPLSPGLGFSDTGQPDGFIGGGQIGYNWQYSPLIVVGFEADFQGALERDNVNLSNSFSCAGSFHPCAFPMTGTALTNYTTEIDWFGTVRGRIGYVWGAGNVLSDVTGGLA